MTDGTPSTLAAVARMLEDRRSRGVLSSQGEALGALALSLAEAIDSSEPVSRPNLGRELRLVLAQLGDDEVDELDRFNSKLRDMGLNPEWPT